VSLQRTKRHTMSYVPSAEFSPRRECFDSVRFGSGGLVHLYDQWRLLFELPEVQQDKHCQRRQWILNSRGVGRQKAPDPWRLVLDVCNDTHHEELSPGVMLTGYAEDKTCLTSAGVLLSKKGEYRLTVAGHGFGPDSPSGSGRRPRWGRLKTDSTTLTSLRQS